MNVTTAFVIRDKGKKKKEKEKRRSDKRDQLASGRGEINGYGEKPSKKTTSEILPTKIQKYDQRCVLLLLEKYRSFAWKLLLKNSRCPFGGSTLPRRTTDGIFIYEINVQKVTGQPDASWTKYTGSDIVNYINLSAVYFRLSFTYTAFTYGLWRFTKTRLSRIGISKFYQKYIHVFIHLCRVFPSKFRKNLNSTR